MAQIKEQEYKTQENSNETDIRNLSNKEFNKMVIKILNKVDSRIEELRELQQGVRKHK